MITTYTMLAIYFLISFLFHNGMYKEWKKDECEEMNKLSPVFIQVCLVTSSLFWPVLIIVALWKNVKEGK